MQILTLVWRFFQFSLDIYLRVICLSHFVTDSVAFLIISAVVIHHTLTLISSAKLQWCMVTCHIAMLHGWPLTRSSFSNDERHMTVFQPISDTAHSWSCDNLLCMEMVYVTPLRRTQPVGMLEDRLDNQQLMLTEHSLVGAQWCCYVTALIQI